jgi:hypothetical protein
MMKTRVKTKRIIFAAVFVVISFALSNYLVRQTSILNFKLIEPTNLFTYFGVLIGFALTVYTFGLAMISDIKKDLMELDDFTKAQKNDMLNRLTSGFKEIKGDIWTIFSSLILIIYFAVVIEIPNPFGWEVEIFMIPQSSNLTLFIVTTYAMYDIMRTLFNLSEIKLELLKKNKKPAAEDGNEH